MAASVASKDEAGAAWGFRRRGLESRSTMGMLYALAGFTFSHLSSATSCCSSSCQIAQAYGVREINGNPDLNQNADEAASNGSGNATAAAAATAAAVTVVVGRQQLPSRRLDFALMMMRHLMKIEK